MKIKKYKYLGNGKYRLTIDDDIYILYEDTILKYSIITKNEISKKELETYLKENQLHEAYYKSVEYINRKLRTKKEITKYLKKDFSNKEIDYAIKKLEKEGYLNEEIYAEAYITDQINLKIVGPLKIKNDLLNLGIDETIINKKLERYSKEEQYNKINKLIEKDIRLNNNKSVMFLKNKILRNLIDKGFYKEDIETCIDNHSFNDEEIYKKEYQKAYDKLSKKYSGATLEYKIKEKMYQKGFKTN